MPRQLSEIQDDLADVREGLDKVNEDQKQTQQQLAALAERDDQAADQVTREDLADLGFKIDQSQRNIAVVGERVDDLGVRFDRLAAELGQAQDQMRRASVTPAVIPVPVAEAGASPADVPAGGGAPGPPPDPEELYNTAYADFSKGNYTLAVSGFEDFYRLFPDSAQADNAVYRVGECHFSQGNFPDAIVAFDRLLDEFPDSDMAAAGNLKKGLAYLEQNQIQLAIVQLQHVERTFPGTDEARIATDKLASLGSAP
jgi:tol-pal system protein YbgF